jgi:hypothetical protein
MQLGGVRVREHLCHAAGRPGRRRVDVDDAGVGMRTPEDGGMEHPGTAHVAGEATDTLHEPLVLAASHAATDPGHGASRPQDNLTVGHGVRIVKAVARLALTTPECWANIRTTIP